MNRQPTTAATPRRALLQPLEPRRLFSAYLDLRLPDGGHTVNNATAGQVVPMELWGVVTGADATTSNEDFKVIFGSLLSINPNGGTGSVRGNLTATLAAQYQGFPATTTVGTARDLDGDGDTDLGSNDPTTAAGFLFASVAPGDAATGTPVGEGAAGARKEFKIADVTFTVTSVTGGALTRVVFQSRPTAPGRPTVVWLQDGAVLSDSAQLSPGRGVQFFGPDSAGPTAAVNLPAPQPGTSTYDFTVTYTDDQDVNTTTIDSSDVRVQGPNGYNALATLVSVTGNEFEPRVATYRVAAPGGTWDTADNGDYTATVQPNAVSDLVGNAVQVPAPASMTFNIVTPTFVNVDPRKGATFTDAAGNKVTVRLTGGGTAKLVFPAGSLTTNANASGIVVDNSTARSVLTVTSRKPTAMSTLQVNGPLATLNARSVNLSAGALAITGPARTLQLGNVSTSTISTGAGGATAVTLGAVQDSSLTSAGALSSLNVATWTDTDATPDAITATAVGPVTSKANFAADITAGSIRTLNVRGALTDATLRATAIGPVTVNTSANNRVYAGMNPALTAFPTAADFGSGALLSFTVKSRAPGAFSNTIIASPSITTATLGAVTAANNATRFGVAAKTLRSVTAVTTAGKISKRNLKTPGDVIPADQDFRITLF
jgi:hypothetical protein